MCTQVEFGLPDLEGRQHIFKIHCKRMNVDKRIRYELLARLCPNTTGAEIRSVCTEAGMFAIRARRKSVSEKDMLDAVEKVSFFLSRAFALVGTQVMLHRDRLSRGTRNFRQPRSIWCIINEISNVVGRASRSQIRSQGVCIYMHQACIGIQNGPKMRNLEFFNRVSDQLNT